MDPSDSALPLAPLALRPGAPPPPGRTPWQRLRDGIAAYLPILLMAMLAGATWWLVKNTPVPQQGAVAGRPPHEPDYEMSDFSVQRFTREGPANSVLKGRRMVHYPDTDTIEIDGVSLLWTDDTGARLVATAQRARASADGTQVELMGAAHVVREPAPGTREERFEFSGEHLMVWTRQDRVRADQPVTIVRGTSVLSAQTLDYDRKSGLLELGGRVRGRVLPPSDTAASR